MKTVTFDEEKWQLVPKEPTQDMIIAGGYAGPFSTVGIYKAFIKAAPQLPKEN